MTFHGVPRFKKLTSTATVADITSNNSSNSNRGLQQQLQASTCSFFCSQASQVPSAGTSPVSQDP